MLTDIRQLAETALQDADAFYDRLTSKLGERISVDEGTLKKELDTLATRDQEIDTLFMSLYADKAKGILNEKRFLQMTETLEQEQAQNKSRTQEIMDTLSRSASKDNDVKFISEIRKCASITELDEAILNRLIDRIGISEVQVVDGEKVQKVKIVYNFVGEIQECVSQSGPPFHSYGKEGTFTNFVYYTS